jgi:hypothetical protein
MASSAALEDHDEVSFYELNPWHGADSDSTMEDEVSFYEEPNPWHSADGDSTNKGWLPMNSEHCSSVASEDEELFYEELNPWQAERGSYDEGLPVDPDDSARGGNQDLEKTFLPVHREYHPFLKGIVLHFQLTQLT